MNCTDPICFLTECGTFGSQDTPFIGENAVCIGAMIDWGYAGYQDVSVIAPETVQGSEVLIGVSFAAFPPEVS
jgi:hypothetical protein